MGKKEISLRIVEMLRLRTEEGMSHADIGRLQTPPISRQRVDQLLKPFPMSKRYALDDDERAQEGKRGGIKGLFDKIILRVKKSA